MLSKSTLKSVINFILINAGLNRTSAIKQSFKSLTQTYDNRRQADGWVKKGEELSAVEEEGQNFIYEIVNSRFPNGAKILDYGCGTGRYLEMFRGKKNTLFGLDLNDDVLTRFTGKHIPEGTFASIDLTNKLNSEKFIAEHKGTFQCIYLVSVLQYIQPPKLGEFIDTLSKLLVENGVMIVLFPLPSSFLHRYEKQTYHRYPPKKLRNELQKQGFEVIEEYSSVYKEKLDLYQPHENDFGYFMAAQRAKK